MNRLMKVKVKIKMYVDLMNQSDLVYLTRILISLEDYWKEKVK